MNRLQLVSALALAATIVGAARAGAQTRPQIEVNEGRTLDDLKEGARIRLGLYGEDPGARVRASLVGFGQTTMIVQMDGARRELPFSSIITVDEAYRDRKRGAIAGALIAAVGVYAWDFFGSHRKYRDQDKRYKENAVALGIGAPAAALVGAAIGWPRWREIGTPGR